MALSSGRAVADDLAEFYKGKTLVFAIGTGAGGEYDLQARLLARHIGHFIPGNPQAVAQNMPGAGGAKMAAWLYNVAPKDGTHFGVIMNNFPASQAVGAVDLHFDVTKFNWIGAIGALTQTITAWTASGIKTLDDLKTKEYIAGASGRGAITYTLPAAMNALLGTRMKIVTGYQGGNDINLAMERGEVHVRSNSWSSWKTTRPDWIAEKKITVLAQSGRRSAELPNIPSLEDLTTGPDDRKIMELVVSGNYIGRPQAMPPGTPTDKVAAMRAAFQATVKDPAFIAEVKKLHLELDPVSGEELQSYITKLQDVPERLIPESQGNAGITGSEFTTVRSLGGTPDMSVTLDEMSARDIDAKSRAAAAKIPSLLISADSHVDEPANMFDELPQAMRDKIKRPNLLRDNRPKGGMDPKVRIKDMELDGISAEVLYPTFTLGLFATEPDVQQAAFRIYNDWLADYCKTAPKKLFGVPCLAVYDIDAAIKEMHRCNDMGLLGGLVWQVPDPKLPIASSHYEKLWAAAAELGYPINFHILTGFNYKRESLRGMEKIRGSVNIKTADAVTCVFDLIWAGTFERHPKLKVEIVESEIGWMPFYIQQWDYYYKRNVKHGGAEDFLIKRLPSEIFNEHVYATFMDDFVGGQALKYWGDRNIMWSSDYPHPNMTWPNSRAFLARQIGDLDPARQKRVLSQNVIDLYKLKI